jgi:stearoyl-CoA desaturase (Delta-9 desaturase)
MTLTAELGPPAGAKISRAADVATCDESRQNGGQHVIEDVAQPVPSPGSTPSPAGPSTGVRGWRALASGFRPSTSLFWGVHVAAAICAVVFFSWKGVLLAIASYFVRMVLVTAAYHRYFSHRAFKTSRVFQFVLALGAQSSAQKGVLWWAGHHRHHHKFSDEAQDIHSVRHSGFWHAHLGWILGPDWDGTNHAMIGDLSKFPELRILNHSAVMLLPAVALAFACLWLGGVHGFVWGFLVSTVMLWHGSFSINSLSHLFGKRRYETTDDSRNNWALALLTTGEGWHNNHHHYQSSANQGFRWWEIDVTFYFLRALELLGVIWDVRRPPASVIADAAG